MRTCTGCGVSRPKDEMVRVVAGPDGRMFPDLTGKAPGRGGYLCPARECIVRAARGRLVSVLKLAASARVDGGKGGMEGEALGAAVAAALKARILSLLGLARRQGMAVTGSSLVEGELRKDAEGWGLLLTASDAAPGAAGKLDRRARDAHLATAAVLTRDEMGKAMGQSPRSAVMVREGSLSRALGETLVRLHAVSAGSTTKESGDG
jgi:predicted RNA-binding protein YlxR (DUF448 family)/ribosomal protein L7Ae-like RNA K-turn-binding protein